MTVVDDSKVADALLKQSGALGIMKSGTGIQVVYGPKVTVIKTDIEDYLETIGKALNN